MPKALPNEPTGTAAAPKTHRARKTRDGAITAENGTENQPSLGSLNRHLATVMQQLTAAHQIIGRVVAERDALRQQLADLQGIPVEEVPIPTIGASAPPTADVMEPPVSEARVRSRLARLIPIGRRPRQSE